MYMLKIYNSYLKTKEKKMAIWFGPWDTINNF